MKNKRLIQFFFVQSVAILFFSFFFVPHYFLSPIKTVNYVNSELRFAENLTVWHQIPHRRILIYPVAYEDFARNKTDAEKLIKVLAAKDPRESLQYICYGYSIDGKIVELGAAKDDLVATGQVSLFDAYFIYCPCKKSQGVPEPKAQDLIGISVTEMSNSSVIPSEPMARIQRFHSGGFEQNFTVCVNTMTSYSQANQLELFLKYYRSHGVNKFVFYYQNSSYAVEEMLRKVQNNPRFGAEIELILWPNPFPDLKLV